MKASLKHSTSLLIRTSIVVLFFCALSVLHFIGQAAESNNIDTQSTKSKTAPNIPSTKNSSHSSPAPKDNAAAKNSSTISVKVEASLVHWTPLDKGLEFLKLGLSWSGPGALLVSAPASPADLVILRVNPEYYEFTLHMASEDGTHRSLYEHAAENNLTAAINAGMYLPDQLTNTGFMQSSTHTNNPRIASRFGSFFVAEPDGEGLPLATLMEKESLGQNLQDFLSHYKLVVQNFRLINAQGKILWPESQNLHSISALSQDKNGNILLILCRFQLSPSGFANLLLSLPLDCTSAMYLEGGSECGLLLKIPGRAKEVVWRGKHNSILPLDGAPEATLPNVIGIRPRSEENSNISD